MVQALRKLAGKALNGPVPLALALAGFAGLYLFNLPFPLVIIGAAFVGFLTASAADTTTPPPRPKGGHSLRSLALWGGLWAAPLVLAFATDAEFLFEIGLYFSQLAVLTFGGAYAVLTWMAQTVVVDHGWITTGQMMDALGLAETTPGPLILVTQFVAHLAGFGAGGPALGLLAGLMAIWTTFLPCFLWIFLGAPYVDWLMAQPRLTGALRGITAAVVGVIANLSLWFALHMLFTGMARQTPLWPMWSSLDLRATLLVALAALLMGPGRVGLLTTLVLMAGGGLILGGLNILP